MLWGAFGLTERLRAQGPGGRVIHAQLSIGDGDVMIGASGAEFRPPRSNEVSQYVLVRVEDVERHFDHSKRFGARIVHPPRSMPFGETVYTVRGSCRPPLDVFAVGSGCCSGAMGRDTSSAKIA